MICPYSSTLTDQIHGSLCFWTTYWDLSGLSIRDLTLVLLSLKMPANLTPLSLTNVTSFSCDITTGFWLEELELTLVADFVCNACFRQVFGELTAPEDNSTCLRKARLYEKLIFYAFLCMPGTSWPLQGTGVQDVTLFSITVIHPYFDCSPKKQIIHKRSLQSQHPLETVKYHNYACKSGVRHMTSEAIKEHVSWRRFEAPWCL